MKSFFLYLSCGLLIFVSNRFYNLLTITDEVINGYFILLVGLVSFEILIDAGVDNIELEKYAIRLIRKLKLLTNQGKNFHDAVLFITKSKEEDVYEDEIKKLLLYLENDLDTKKSSLKFAKRLNSKILEKYLPKFSLNPDSLIFSDLDEELKEINSLETENKNTFLKKYLNLIGFFWFLVGSGIFIFAAYYVYLFINSIFIQIFSSIKLQN